ncbi:hypothetical protein [Amycolatopsis sp. NPDC049159]|uniref:hypothetical protein n=1 Tax=Amycolatopsis sp. NPDC049159 TaxID=3157210 RepID=UPI0033C5AD59
MTTLLEAANYHQTRRHYTKELNERGRGYALCSLNGADWTRVDVYDQTAIARVHALGGEAKDNATLPLCKRCVKSAAAQGFEVPA